MSDFEAELTDLIEKAAQHATNAAIHWWMKDTLSVLHHSPQFVRNGNFKDGWLTGDIVTGWYIPIASPDGSVPGRPWWGRHHHRSDLVDSAQSVYDSYRDGIESFFAKWRTLPDPVTIADEADAILENSAWHINWSFDSIQVQPELDSWLSEIERDPDVQGAAFDVFYDKYAPTRAVLSHNLLKNIIDIAACRAADAAAIKGAEEGALSLAAALESSMAAAVPDAGVSSGEAFWNTVGIVAQIVPAKGAAEPVLKGVQIAQGLATAPSGAGRTISGDRPEDVYTDFVAAEDEFRQEYDAGVADIEKEANAIVTRLDNDTLSALPVPSPSTGTEQIQVTKRKIDTMSDAMDDLKQAASDAAGQVKLDEDLFARSGALATPLPEIRLARARLVDRLWEIGNELGKGSENLQLAWREYEDADRWSEEAQDAIEGRTDEVFYV